MSSLHHEPEREWRVLDAARWLQVGEDGFVPDFPVDEPVIVPLRLWLARRDELAARRAPVAILINGGSGG